jgi:hypothetical protein
MDCNLDVTAYQSKGITMNDKIKNAKTDGWLAEGMTEEEIEEAISEAKAERDKELSRVKAYLR